MCEWVCVWVCVHVVLRVKEEEKTSWTKGCLGEKSKEYDRGRVSERVGAPDSDRRHNTTHGTHTHTHTEREKEIVREVGQMRKMREMKEREKKERERERERGQRSCCF